MCSNVIVALEEKKKHARVLGALGRQECQDLGLSAKQLGETQSRPGRCPGMSPLEQGAGTKRSGTLHPL